MCRCVRAAFKKIEMGKYKNNEVVQHKPKKASRLELFKQALERLERDSKNERPGLMSWVKDQITQMESEKQ